MEEKKSDLRDANLSRVNLSEADLSGVNLRWAVGNNKQIKTIQTGRWVITYTKDQMAIGCKQYSIKDWMSFSDKKINNMNSAYALEFWKFWKPILMSIFKQEGVL